jgi:queuosine precursor transporter
MTWTIAYIIAIVAVNWMFTAIAPWSTPLGDLYVANIVVGFVFVLRDYAQRAIGQRVLLATTLAGLPVWWFAGKDLAIASLTAFFVAELVDWAIYSFWKKPLQQRILVSSLVAVPLDTMIFQNMAGYYSPASFTTEVISKFIGVAIVWYLLRLRFANVEGHAAV